MSTTTTHLGMVKNADGEFGWQQDQRDNWDKLDTEAARVANKIDPQHDANGDHRDIVIQGGATLGGVQRNTWPTPGSATVALTDVLTNGEKGNIPAAGAFELRNNTGATTHFAVDEATGKVTKINLAGMLGNISDPLVHIPFRRANDEVRLSGTQTFTRASTGTYVDPLDGLVKTAAIDTPRFERMADGGVGVLLEGASTNVLLNSNDVSLWSTLGAPVVVANNAVSPDGTTNAGTVTYVPSDAVMQTVTLAASTTYTLSVWVRLVSGTSSFQLSFWDLSTGAVTSPIYTPTSTWQRVEFTATSSASGMSQERILFGGTGVMEVWGFQCEALPFASSYIPTTTAAVTRAGDSLTLAAPGNIIDIAYANVEWTLVADFDVAGQNPNNGYLLHIATGGTADMKLLTDGINSRWVFRHGLTYVYSGSTSPSGRIAFRHTVTAQELWLGGQRLVSATAEGTNSGISTIYIGRHSSSADTYGIFGHIRNFRIYERALTASEIAAA